MIKDKCQIVSVQASAGSGKTYSLAKRYITLLLGAHNDEVPASIKNIIAVTFANKAAVEMKYRVMEYLKKAALFLDTGDVFDGLRLSAKEKSARSAKALNDILENYDSFNISTIDSFINRILKACAINIGVSPNFTVEKDASDNLSFAVDSLLKKASTEPEAQNLFSQYLMQYLISEKSGWFPKNDIYNEVKNVFKKAGYNGKDIAGSEAPFGDGLVGRSKKIRELVKRFAANFMNLDINGHFKNAVNKVVEDDGRMFYRLKIPKNFSYKELKYNKNSETNAAADSLWEEITSAISEFCEFYAENYYGVYGKIFSDIGVEFDRQAKNEEVVFLNEINKKTTGFFESADSVMPEVYYRLSERYKHFLIDEFQDTSSVQWSVLKRFLEESLAVGGTFFYVGDAKQAIYDFRGGNSEIFYKALRDFSQMKCETATLAENYRSHKTLVDFNNGVFSRENLELYLKEANEIEDLSVYEKLLGSYSSSKQNFNDKKDKGYVEIEILDMDSGEDAVQEKFLEYVKTAAERFSLNDIAVLCRTNGEAFEAGRWLLEEGYNVESEQTLNLKNNSVIKQIISLITFINSPLDALSFSSFISGEVFQKASGMSREECDKFLFERNKNGEREVFYKVFSDKYPELWSVYFEEFFGKAGFMPVYELSVAVFEKFKIVENFPEAKIFVLRFLELVKEFEKDDSGINDFVGHFESLDENDEILYVKNASADAVKVMTIHKAKGLQFGVVILPFLKLSEQTIDRPYFDGSKNSINLLYITGGLAEFSPKLKNIYDSEKAKLLFSEINVLYVSMTRAERELYGIILPKGKNTAQRLIGGQSVKLGSKYGYKPEAEKIEEVPDGAGGGYKNVYYKLANRALSADSAAERLLGSILHFVLSQITTLKNKDVGQELSEALDFAEKKFPDADLSPVREILSAFFTVPEIKKIFGYDEIEVYNEIEIVTSEGETLRIDKLIEKGSEAFIYEFKSSQITQDNIKQVEKYKKHISQICGEKKVSGFLAEIKSGKITKV